MDPVSLAVVSLGSTVASGAMGVMGAANTARASSEEANYRAAIARNNKIIADRNAEIAVQTGLINVETQGLKTRAIMGEQKAVQAAKGVDVNSGSPLAVRQSTHELGELDAMTIMNNALQRSAGYKAQGTNFESEATLYDMKASNASKAGEYAMASSIVGSASSFSDKWLGYQQKGII